MDPKLEQFMIKLQLLLEEYDAGIFFSVSNEFYWNMEVYVDGSKNGCPDINFDDEAGFDSVIIERLIKSTK